MWKVQYEKGGLIVTKINQYNLKLGEKVGTPYIVTAQTGRPRWREKSRKTFIDHSLTLSFSLAVKYC